MSDYVLRIMDEGNMELAMGLLGNSEKIWWHQFNHHREDILDILHRFLPTAVAKIDEDVKNKSDEVFSWMKLAWWEAPDTEETRSLPGWEPFCSLCSTWYEVLDDRRMEERRDRETD